MAGDYTKAISNQHSAISQSEDFLPGLLRHNIGNNMEPRAFQSSILAILAILAIVSG